MRYLVSRRIGALMHAFEKKLEWKKQDIIYYIEECDFKYSERTFHRDIITLSADFGVELEYSRLKKTYAINTRTSDINNHAVQVLDLINTSEFIKEGLTGSKHLKKHIQIDKDSIFPGSDLLTPILKAIDKKKYLYFEYTSHRNPSRQEVNAFPVFLKRHGLRWYLIALNLEKNGLRAYGLERIHLNSFRLGERKKMDLSHLKTEIANRKSLFGVGSFNFDKEKIIFHCDDVKKRYLVDLPLHSSQKIKCLGENIHEVSYFLVITDEFKGELLRNIPYIQLVEPKSLISEFKENMKTFLGDSSQ